MISYLILEEVIDLFFEKYVYYYDICKIKCFESFEFFCFSLIEKENKKIYKL